MRGYPKTVFGRLALMQTIVLLVVGSVIGYLSIQAQGDFALEADQRLHTNLAANLATEFAPFIRGMPDYDRVEETIHDLMVYNPRIEIYVLDTTGTILSYFSDPEKIVRNRVETAPIARFLEGDYTYPFLGEDPRSADGYKPFSAANIDLGDRQGYLYVILGGELVDTSISLSSGSHISRLLGISIVLVLLISGIISVGLFFVHTRRFQTMRKTVRRFASGDLSARILVSGDDDVTELSRTFNVMADRIKDTLEELKRTDEQRREQVANISHDLKTPLSSILGFVETIQLRGESLSEEERDRYLKVVRDNAETLSRLVLELSELARLDSVTLNVSKEPFNVDELVQDVTMSFVPIAREKDISLNTQLTAKHPRVCADLGMIERVLTNLIRNAIQYTDDGEVSVIVEQDIDDIVVRVKDTGCGIPQQDLPLVTKRFYRVEKSRRSGAGLGLGLSIAEMILHLHGSRLSIESAVGLGSTLSFSLKSEHS